MEREMLIDVTAGLCEEYEQLNLSNDFMFGKVMQNKNFCISMLKLLTGSMIEDVETVSIQHAVRITNDSRGVRYDVYVQDKNRLYDTEMQNKNNKNELPRRSRYYHSIIDMSQLEKNTDYKELKETFVIFICTFDPFGFDLCFYDFETLCTYDRSIMLEDDRHTLFYNTKGRIKNVSEETAKFLEYIETGRIGNEFTQKLADAVDIARHNRIWKGEYMKTLLHDRDVRMEGYEQGMEQGIRKGINAMIDTCRSLGADEELIIQSLINSCDLSEDEAREYLKKSN